MKVDQNTLLLEEGYTPVAGCEYEIAPGVVGTMKPITVSLQDDVLAKAGEDSIEDFAVMKMLLSGVDEAVSGDCYVGMPSRVVADFFSLLVQIRTGLSNSSVLSSLSQLEESQETQE